MLIYMCTIGGVFLVAGLWLLGRRVAILPRAVRVRGQIAHWEARQDHENPHHFNYFPHVRFVDRHGVEHIMRVDFGYASEKWPIGHVFDVRYDPNEPKRAYAANLGLMLVGPFALTLLGAGTLAAGIVAMR